MLPEEFRWDDPVADLSGAAEHATLLVASANQLAQRSVARCATLRTQCDFNSQAGNWFVGSAWLQISQLSCRDTRTSSKAAVRNLSFRPDAGAIHSHSTYYYWRSDGAIPGVPRWRLRQSMAATSPAHCSPKPRCGFFSPLLRPPNYAGRYSRRPRRFWRMNSSHCGKLRQPAAQR